MNKYFNVSLKCVTYISIPMAFGLIAISDQFVPWFLDLILFRYLY
ncbi:hypothetical protein [Clostridium butyricum]|nr:hypothetical protein [Clostridium butyricum]